MKTKDKIIFNVIIVYVMFTSTIGSIWLLGAIVEKIASLF